MNRSGHCGSVLVSLVSVEGELCADLGPRCQETSSRIENLGQGHTHPEARGSSPRTRTDRGMGPAQGQDTRPLPLNSHKLTLPLLRQLTAELEVPRQTASGDMRSLIEAVISEGGSEP